MERRYAAAAQSAAMERRYARSSSLATKFFEDFPDADAMPLPLLSEEEQREAWAQLVRPLLDLSAGDRPPPELDDCVAAAERLAREFARRPGAYAAARGVCDYVQSRLALALVDAAGARAVPAGAAEAAAALEAADPGSARELLREDVRRKLVANGLAELGGGGVAVPLDRHPAVAAAKPCPADPDRLLLPAEAGYASARPAGRRQAGGGDGGEAGWGPSILKRAARRRQLARGSGHYLAPLLGRDGAGTVVLTGPSLLSAVRGAAQPQAGEVSDGGGESVLAFAGYPAAAGAHEALANCTREALTRYFARHPAPVLDSAGQPVEPLAVATARHLVLLLPEPAAPQLPAAVALDAVALGAAAEAGAWQGPAAAAAAAAQAPAAAPAADPAGGPGFRDVAVRFNLALHPSLEAMLLAADGPLEGALAYDGDDVHALPSAVRALASGGAPPDAAAAAWCAAQHAPAAAAPGESAAALGAAAAAAGGGAEAAAPLSPASLAASPRELRALLDHGRRRQQAPAPGGGAQAEHPLGGDATRQRVLQQLRHDHGWVWAVVGRPGGAAQQQQLLLPTDVHDAVRSRWWAGPVMRGSALLGDVLEARPA